MAKSFALQMADIRARMVNRLEAVAKESLADVVQEMQTPRDRGGRLPVDTGRLRESLASGKGNALGQPAADSYVSVISTMQLGDVVRFGYTAPYAYAQEVGTATTSGNHFMGAAAARWPAIVAANAKRAR